MADIKKRRIIKKNYAVIEPIHLQVFGGDFSDTPYRLSDWFDYLCPNCGQKLDYSDCFCRKCGIPIFHRDEDRHLIIVKDTYDESGIWCGCETWTIPEMKKIYPKLSEEEKRKMELMFPNTAQELLGLRKW